MTKGKPTWSPSYRRPRPVRQGRTGRERALRLRTRFARERVKERSSTPLPSPCTLSRRIALRRACFVNVSPLEFGKSNRPRPCGGSGSGRAGPAKWASKEARSSFCTSLSHNLTWNPPPFCLVTASALLGQYRGEPFPGATHTPASIARSRGQNAKPSRF